MRRKFLQAVLIQALAPLLLLGLAVLISRFLGPADQGAFAFAKSWFDLLVVIGCFGFPQSFVIAINRDATSRKILYKATLIYAVCLLPIFFIASLVFGGKLTNTGLLAIAISMGAACVVLVNLWRGILLTIDDGLRFQAITMLPTIFLVAVVSVCAYAGFSLLTAMPYFYTAIGSFALITAYFIIPWGSVKNLQGSRPNAGKLIKNGVEVFVQALAMSLQGFICLSWLKHGANLAEVGYFSMALVLINACIFPLQAVAPMVLNAWSKGSEGQALHSGKAAILKATLFLTMLSAAIAALIPYLAPIVLGQKFVNAVPAMQVAVLGLVPAFLYRMDSLRLSAASHFQFNSIVAAIRCLLFIALIFGSVMIPNVSITALTAATCWVLAEISAASLAKLKVSYLKK